MEEIINLIESTLPFLKASMSKKAILILGYFGYPALVFSAFALLSIALFPKSKDIFIYMALISLIPIPVLNLINWTKEKYSICICENCNKKDENGKIIKLKQINEKCKLHGIESKKYEIALGK